ncbi:tyrosine-protein phosphatase [Sporolactobacillus pectinivorans]|uniref:tyrosine-protein phosphatase n=1 Tax=Sporolactobacillus pectinivorans TaxID=1591408 RepID=UPI000C25E02E|nr:tyrosine-protein phosphatase [Sporolactobacillus pectinivorans]
MFLRRVPLSSTLNTRDLGGYPTADGKVTKFGRIIRSGAPLILNKGDIALLKSLGVTAAIDFRSNTEIAKKPSAFEQSADFDYFHCPFLIGNKDPGSKDEVPSLYARIISDFSAIGQIMRIIAEQKGAVLIHCAAGKDRTGVVSALLLLTAGVGIDDILADYQVSYTYLRLEIRERMKRDTRLPSYFGRSDMEYMEKTLEQFSSTYGNVQKYLQTVGLTQDEVRGLKNKLL